MTNIISNLYKIKELPTLPEVVLKVQELLNSEDSNATRLSNVIQKDPALTSTILKIANSAFYSTSSKRIISIARAITRIGFNEVSRISMSISIIQQFSKTQGIINYKTFWHHSLTAANMTSVIADMMETRLSEEERQNLFLSGLLHDIGIIIYDQFFHEEFAKIIDLALIKGESYLNAEKAISPNETHAFIGGVLLEIWRLGLPVISAVRYHHIPKNCPEKFRTIVSIVSLTEYILCNGYMRSLEGRFDDMDDSVFEIMHISPDDIKLLFQKAGEEARKADLFLSVSNDYLRKAIFKNLNNNGPFQFSTI